MTKKNKTIRAILFIILVIFAVYTIMPIFWVFVTSLKTPEEAREFPPSLIPKEVTFQNYQILFQDDQMMRSFLNSIIVAVPATLLCVIISALAAFSFSRYHFKGKKQLLAAVMGVFMIPITMNTIPLYLIFQRMGLLDTYAGVILAYQVLIIPLNIFILKNHFDTIPISLEEAAALDGASTMQRFTKVIMPLSWPGLSISFIFTFRFAWNEFVLPMILISSPSKTVFQVAMYRFLGLYSIDWGLLSAAIVIGMIPILIIIIFFQRQLLQGIQAGSIKG
ncbi:binding-protein-dependent transport systems inner membrane component [Petrotoga mobilis SJ95]|uniref:Binding-protein-dependent transport systems inner membrane component n=1 Tax=Petrotoga mobilis (strain DSM 10674 / SJ95) TaxID=403833 RepID=A9BIN0_PETMO|nr:MULTISPECIES: carbohydrate ABC transporter permease [Petrotoga]ABX32193.1 binding-protein-dependent transport systems inner membrane component [Petrotoga mobilis SJ95]PNR88472.1 ABC transporter permease [Petrotoga sp. 9T1HF07.CasAA.8.2]PNR94386.1 ABC transporter permease [Petrotoga sp. HWHPT.55.6.3]RPD35350.1 ABC transporter permease [Petrotoga sp. HWH.PT.55.6.1]